MYRQDFDAICVAAENKLSFMRRSLLGYIVASMLAGLYVAFGGIVAMTVGGLLSAAGSPWAKLAAAFSFTVALSLVVMAGSELFTGNNMVMGAAVLARRVRLRDALKLWIVCWLGNLIGAWVAVLIYRKTGLVTGSTAAYFASTASAKLSLTIPEALARSVLCNICVCLAVWCGLKMRSESGKLIMIFWCIFLFMVSGFEHSIANMSILGVALLDGSAGFWGYIRNLFVVSLGNMIGGIFFVALPYFLASREKDK